MIQRVRYALAAETSGTAWESWGGAVYVENGTFELSGTGVIENCSAAGRDRVKESIDGGNGGAVYLANGIMTVSGGMIRNNCRAAAEWSRCLCFWRKGNSGRNRNDYREYRKNSWRRCVCERRRCSDVPGQY